MLVQSTYTNYQLVEELLHSLVLHNSLVGINFKNYNRIKELIIKSVHEIDKHLMDCTWEAISEVPSLLYDMFTNISNLKKSNIIVNMSEIVSIVFNSKYKTLN